MISKISGQVTTLGAQEIFVDIGSLVFKVFVPDPTVYPILQPAEIHVEMIWKETGPTLYGFTHPSEIILFHELLKIQSVGPKLALNIMSYPRERFLSACQAQTSSELCQISGVGKKTALRIIAELDLTKIPALFIDSQSSLRSQARLALLNLGFAERQIDEVLSEYKGSSLDQCLKESLLKLGEHRRVTTSRNRSIAQTEIS